MLGRSKLGRGRAVLGSSKASIEDSTPCVSNLDARNCAAPGGSRGNWSRPGDLRLDAGFWNQMVCGVAISDILCQKLGVPVGLQLLLLFVCDACVTTPSLLTATSALCSFRVRACFEPGRPWGLIPQSAVTNPGD